MSAIAIFCFVPIADMGKAQHFQGRATHSIVLQLGRTNRVTFCICQKLVCDIATENLIDKDRLVTTK